MKIFISEFDRHNACKAAIIPLAKLHNIENYEFKSLYELYIKLSEIESPAFNELRDYLTAYDSWFEFYAEKKLIEDEQNIDYELDDSEKFILGDLILKREKSLTNLLVRFQEIQKL